MNPRQLTKRQSHLRSISSFHSEHDACPISDAALSALEFHEKLPTIIPVTPLPMKTVIVLSLVVFSEPMSMTVLFPFVYFMVRDFGIVDKDIGFYAGYIASSFSIAQFLTSILWGTMSDKFGRRPILLIGLFGNTITCLAFGVSKSLLWAVTSRFCCGLLNGIAKSVMGEITDSTNASIGFSLFGLVWGLGMILGPILGGFLSYPATKFPQVFGNCLFLKTYPYFLPCAVSACISLVGLIVGYIYLDETCPKRINQGKEYIKVTDSPYSPEILDTVEETDEPDYTSLQINEQIISDSITTLAPDSRNTERISWASITVIQGYALLSFVNIIFDEVFSLYMVSPLIYGGLETTSTTIGSVLSIIGVVQLTCQLTVFPWLCMRFDVIDVYRAGITPYPIIFLLFPVISGFIAPYNKPLAFTCLIIVLSVRQLCNVLSFTGINMLTNISATRQQLGFVNGVGQTSAAFVRGIGPALGGCLWAVTTGYVFPFNYWFVFYTLSGLSCIGLLHGWFCFPKELRSAECEEQVEFGFE